MENFDTEEWIDNAKSTQEKQFRMAVIIILHAITLNSILRLNMVIKGGILLAIKYNSDRYTRDIDFSTHIKYEEFQEEEFKALLEEKLSESVLHFIEYDIECKLQSFKTTPKPETNPTFPTIKIKIGYANKAKRNAIAKLNQGQAPNVVSIDYSFNEVTQKIDSIQLEDGKEIKAYSYTDLVAEKFRAILQQKVRRKKGRRQDLYDLYRLFTIYGSLRGIEAHHTLESLIIKSKSRDLEIDKTSIRDDVVIEKLRDQYDLLEDEIDSELPDFSTALELVSSEYESLPW